MLSPEAHDFSLDESFDSEDDSDHYDDYSSDAGNASSSDVLNSCTKIFIHCNNLLLLSSFPNLLKSFLK